MGKHTPKVIKIGIFLDMPGLARSRAISGFYRFARNQPSWRIFQFHVQRDSPQLRHIAKVFNPDAIFAGHPDVLRAFGRGKTDRKPYVLLENVEPLAIGGYGASLNVDNIAIGFSAADRLYTLGYRHLAYLGIVFTALPTKDMQMLLRYARIRGAALERRSKALGCDANIYIPNLTEGNLDFPALKAWLRSLPKPCGLLAFSDEDAQYAISTCHAIRINVPKEIGILGIDNEEFICENTVPTLSSIEPDYEGSGFRAAELLFEFLKRDLSHAGAKETYAVAKIEERLSAQSIMSSAIRVNKAREIIRECYTTKISPREIALQMNVSLRVLELAFKHITGHGITSEILNQRMQAAKKQLKTTQLGIGDIAVKCGFSNYPAFLASFRRKFNMTPGQWRES